MATTKEFQDRLRNAVREALKRVLAEGDLPDGESGEALFTQFESLALIAGDAVSLEVIEQQLEQSDLGNTQCPDCGAEGKRVKRKSRTIQTRRGLDVPFEEQECYCTGCRRSFFPTGPNAGSRRGL